MGTHHNLKLLAIHKLMIRIMNIMASKLALWNVLGDMTSIQLYASRDSIQACRPKNISLDDWPLVPGKNFGSITQQNVWGLTLFDVRYRSPATRDISAIMRKVRSGDTAPEIKFRKALWRRGLRYRVSPRSLPGKPDVVLPGLKLAVFVDGEYWHGGQWQRRKLRALEDQFAGTASRNYWLSKIRGNMERDCVATAALQSKGWTVLRFWESEINSDLEGCVDKTIEAADGAPGSAFQHLASKSFADFFAGIGLMRLGLERQGWHCAFANDLDPAKYEMYSGNFEETSQHYVVQDVHELPASDVPSVTLATAAFPCNDLSLAGSRQGLTGESSSAFWGFVRILREMGGRKPPVVLIENVPGFLTSHIGRGFQGGATRPEPARLHG